MENNRLAAYNYLGTILFSDRWPQHDQEDYIPKMVEVLRESDQIPITNPEALPKIEEGDFLDLRGVSYSIEQGENGQVCTIISREDLTDIDPETNVYKRRTPPPKE